MDQTFYLGLDIGSISINTVLMNENREIIENRYDYCHGKPFQLLKTILSDLVDKYGAQLAHVALTGTGGQKAAELIGGHFVNEIIAQSTSTSILYPQVRTIIEMGGEDSKLIFMEQKEAVYKSQLTDFAMNSLCAAGTGSFLDQQANRIGVKIEEEFGELALKSEHPPRIAGRCSVFAKSDMIHLQQIATPLHDIVAGLCFAVARNFKSTLGRGKKFETPVIFQGGVAANAGMVRAFREILEVDDKDMIIPEHYASMGAIGAVYHIMERQLKGKAFKGLEDLSAYLESDKRDKKHYKQLTESKAVYNKEVVFDPEAQDKLDVYLGLDIGSLSTNVVLIDDKNNVVARRYLPTASKPLEAIRRGLSEIAEEVGDKVNVCAVGTTGSGRYLTGDFIGADSIQNEITAQATAAIAYDPTVDTIFEIGGQDSKYISIEKGVVVDFEMNKVCAAGTGSFLQEQAEKLNINIIKEFGEKGLSSKQPARLGDRCTVFMESDLNAHQQKGETTENLVGGLAYSIVHNYINRVVGNRRIGNKIFFQGGVTNNRAVVAAFEEVTGKPITIPPHFDVTGAIGAAILARNSMSAGQKTRFKGFDVSKTPYSVDKFICKACSNHCEIRRVKIEGEEKPLFFGGHCDKWDVEERKGKGKGIPNLFKERTKMLMGDFDVEKQGQSGRKTIGIPRGLMIFYQQFPFWRTFFDDLGFDVVISDETDKGIVSKSIEVMTAETCFPVEVMHGHIYNLIDKKVDHVFMPFVVNNKAETNNPTNNVNCPWVQSYPFMVKAAVEEDDIQKKLLVPTLHFRYEKVIVNELAEFAKETFGISKSAVKAAFKKAEAKQEVFEQAVQKRGKEVLANLPEDKQALVILGRPYNTGDPGLNLSLIDKLINLNTLPIPVDFLPLKQENVFEDYPMMYWPNGRKIMEAARITAKSEDLFAVYMGNFRCGPDSFISHFVHEEMNGKPYLNLEVDEHSADAGMITRCEAFLDSLKGYLMVKTEEAFKPKKKYNRPKRNRTLYFPYMRDTAHAVSAAVRACGMDSECLPMQDERDLELGRAHTTGQECFPLICTTGSFLKKLEEPGVNPADVSFFMPDHNGPCRFGEYNKLQRIIFDRLGYHEAEIIAPSNENAYDGLAEGKATKFRFLAWKGIVAVDLLRKMQQERRPYESIKGKTNEIYKKHLDSICMSIEAGAKDLVSAMEAAAEDFQAIPLNNGVRKPVIPIVGEIFMRDNPFCSAFLVDRLEALGAETVMAPFGEWIYYSSYRYFRDSKWRRNLKGLFSAKIQEFSQDISSRKLRNAVKHVAELEREPHLHEALNLCGNYVHKHYDGDPPLALGSASAMAQGDISGIVNILPFTCMPGTLISSVSNRFRKDHDMLPWENIAYDGQQDTNIDTRLQAFMHQAREYAHRKGYDKPHQWLKTV